VAKTNIELILKDIQDPHVRENFLRIFRYLESQTVLNGNFKFFYLEIPNAETNYKFYHGLGFRPKDVILLNAEGDRGPEFRYDLFTKDTMDISVTGPTKLRFLAGSYNYDVGETLFGLTDIPAATGPAGPAGPTGPAGSTTEIILEDIACDSSVYVNAVVRMTGAGIAVNALADSPANSNMMGICIAKSSSVLCNIQVTGITQGIYAGLDVTKDYFLSPTVAGAITNVVPTGAGEILLKVGRPFSASRLLILNNFRQRRAL